MMLALAGCGPNEYQDSNAMTYTTSSGMVDDGGETPSVDQNYAGQGGGHRAIGRNSSPGPVQSKKPAGIIAGGVF
jgi:hypothetical protein